jgi:hypothetical protein
MSSDREEKNMKAQTNEAAQDMPSLPQHVQGALGKQLRKAYGDLLAEPLPEKFTDLLRRLAKGDGKS